jgi:hypothetical protein
VAGTWSLNKQSSVALSFMRHRPANSGNFVSNGDTVYSYALLLAKWTNNGPEWVINPDVARKYSVTTARHVNALLRELPYISR